VSLNEFLNVPARIIAYFNTRKIIQAALLPTKLGLLDLFCIIPRILLKLTGLKSHGNRICDERAANSRGSRKEAFGKGQIRESEERPR